MVLLGENVALTSYRLANSTLRSILVGKYSHFRAFPNISNTATNAQIISKSSVRCGGSSRPVDLGSRYQNTIELHGPPAMESNPTPHLTLSMSSFLTHITGCCMAGAGGRFNFNQFFVHVLLFKTFDLFGASFCGGGSP